MQVAISAVVLTACLPLGAADRVKELQERFDHESRATGKIKVLDKLGDAEFDAATKASESNDFSTVGLTFEKYRDNVRASFELLTQQEPDADRHPGGYRQLELLVRRGIRQVSDMLLVMPDVVRPPMQIVRKDLIDLDDALIRKLFPRRSKDLEKTPPPPESKP